MKWAWEHPTAQANQLMLADMQGTSARGGHAAGSGAEQPNASTTRGPCLIKDATGKHRGHAEGVILLTLVPVAVAVLDVIRRPRASWTSERERRVWLALLLTPVPATLLSFSVVGPLIAVVVLVAYCALRREGDRAATA